MMEFQFSLKTKIHFGAESFTYLYQYLKDAAWEKLAIIVDHNIVEVDIVKALINEIGNIKQILIGEVKVAEPTYKYLEELRKPFKSSSVDAVLGIGGGSALDAAKAIAVLVNNKKEAIHYRGFDKMTEPVLPIIAIPTTAGTASEITPNASFVDDEAMKKLGINGESIRPEAAFLDPRMLLSCPLKPAISAGMDALVHAVEAFSAKKSTYMSQMYSKEAVGLILNNLDSAVLNKEVEAYEKVFLGSLFAGVAMMHSGTGPAAAVSYPLGVHKKVPHGLAGGLFLPHIMEWNVNKGYFRYEAFASGLKNCDPVNQAEEKARCVVKTFKALWKRLNAPPDLSEYNFSKDDLEPFTDELMTMKVSLNQNPVPMNRQDVKFFLEKFL